MRPSESQKSWLGKIAQRYHDDLTPEVSTYLADRGIDKDVAHGYLLGLVVSPDPLHEAYEGRLSIPYITPTGVVSMRFRCLEDHECRDLGHGKYEGMPGENTFLFNVQALHDADIEVGISEGELDAIVATISGVYAVGVPGAQNWKPHWYRLFDDFERVPILGDGDKAGRAFASKLAHNIPNGEAKVMPTGHDVTSYVVENGAEDFVAFVRE